MERDREPEIRREIDPGRQRRALAADVREGLVTRPRSLPPKYFYDARGSELFERITRLPEYYQTRTERSILERVAPSLVDEVGPGALVEFGAGSAGKTEVLLRAGRERGGLRGYAPIDVSPEAVEGAVRRIGRRYPGLRVIGVVGDFQEDLPLPFADEVRLVLFLGSTIGNFEAPAAAAFLRGVRRRMGPSDAFLVGFDLVKDRDRLVAAYDDAAGVTAAFDLNVLRVIDRELDADFDPDAFEHRAVWNEEAARIEMHLVSVRPQTVRVGALDLELEFDEGETIRTELSHKYTRRSASALLEEGGFEAARWETDPEELFAVALGRPA